MIKKFRAWDTKRKEWYRASNKDMLTYYGFHLFGECLLMTPPFVKDIEYLEVDLCVGYSKKSNIDVYENDIAIDWNTGEEGKSSPPYVISFKNLQTIESLQNDQFSTIEIIGNIHENPEIMKVE